MQQRQLFDTPADGHLIMLSSQHGPGKETPSLPACPAFLSAFDDRNNRASVSSNACEYNMKNMWSLLPCVNHAGTIAPASS